MECILKTLILELEKMKKKRQVKTHKWRIFTEWLTSLILALPITGITSGNQRMNRFTGQCLLERVEKGLFRQIA